MKDDMRTIANTVITALIFAIPHLGYAGISSQDVKTKMMMDLDIIKNTFEVKYAPAEWKKIYADWELDTEIDLAKVKVLETSSITVKDYQ
jgi:hypothetical protein